MIDRVTLHQLIDALPEERLQNVECVLQYEGITPSTVGRIPDEVAARIREHLVTRPIETDDWDSLRTKMRQGIERRRARFPVHPQFEMRDGALRSAGGHNRSSVLVYEPLPEKGPEQSSVEPLERCELTNCFIEVVLSARLLDKPVTRRRKQIALNRAYSKHLHGPGKSRYRFSGYFETTRLCQRVDERIEGSFQVSIECTARSDSLSDCLRRW